MNGIEAKLFNFKMSLTLIAVFLITVAAVSIKKSNAQPKVFIDHAETVNGDELWLTMGDGSNILIELEDEVDKYYINHQGQEYMIFYVSVCEPHSDDCTHYVLVMGEYIEAPNADI